MLSLVASVPRAARADVGDYVGKPIASIRVELETQEVSDPKILQIIEMKAGMPLSMVAVRETVSRLFALGRFEDVRVLASAAGAGPGNAVALVYDLVPVHPVEKINFTGSIGAPGVDTGRLRREVVERYGASPPVGRAPELARIIGDDLHAEGYLHPTITPRAELRHAPDRATLIFGIEPGARTRIADVNVTGSPGLPDAELLKQLHVSAGAPYRSDDIASRIVGYLDDRRSRGYFAATLMPDAQFGDDDRTVHLTLNAVQGPHVRVQFQGDALPADRRGDLVPIEREGSANEDLLEDSTNRIEDYLRAQGYRDAAAPHARVEHDGELIITFTVTKGPLYRIARVELSGNRMVPAADLEAALRVREEQPFSVGRLDGGASAIEDIYRRQGFAAVIVQADEEAAPHEAGAVEVPVTVRIDITENIRTVVNSVRVAGNPAVPEVALRSAMGLQPGRPFFLTQMAIDRDVIQQQYANLGFQSATVDSNPGLSADHARADVVFTVHEGPRLLIDHVLIVGNVRTRTETIERELQFKAGGPLGLAAVNDTERRLAALGLFRRTTITAIGHGEESRDVLISVDEAPVTSIGYGVGVEAQEVAQGTEESGGIAEQKLEFAPRAFFEIGRRNLFGKNRSVNLFTRLSLRPKGTAFVPNLTQPQETGGAFGFAEYRVLGTFREPHVFGTSADAIVSGTLEQQVRSSFDFARRSLSLEVGRRVTRDVSVSGNYQLQRIRLFNDSVAPQDQPLVDRAFPQVLLSSFSASIVRSTKDDALDPTTGTYLSANGQLAARAIGSEIGLLKSYMRAQWFHTIPDAHRTVLATNATLGLIEGLPRNVVLKDGSVEEDRTIPASERFFAGGDTTVRGFALDQLGTPSTIDQFNGFPIGGNGLVIFNAELRVPYRSLQFVGFIDMGNVFARVSDIDLGELRSAVGFGIRYKSPIGPIRVDVGFKTHRVDIVPGTPESLMALHISLGQAF